MKSHFFAAPLVCLLLACQPGARDAAAPFVIPHALAPVVDALASEAGDWSIQLLEVEGLDGGRVVLLPEDDDAALPSWPTDAWVFGYRGGQRHVLEMPVERGRTSPGGPPIRVGAKRGFPDGRFDTGGNVLVSPPVPARFPFGRIVTSVQMQPALKEFFRAQRVQTGPGGGLIELDTAWLKVGHVDEIVAFVPVPKQGGFRLVLPDPAAGLKLLGSVPADRALFSERQAAGRVSAAGARFLEDAERHFSDGAWKFVRIISGKGAGLVARVREARGMRLTIDRCWDLRGQSPALAVRAAREGECEAMPVWFDVPDRTSRYVAVENCRMWLDARGEGFPAVITAGELAGDAALAATANACMRRIYGAGGVQETICRGLALDPKDTLRLPVVLCGTAAGEDIAAFVPNPVNLVCVGDEVILLAPFGPRRDEVDPRSDVFERAWRAAFGGLGLRPHFLDGWDALHRRDGGARCGTNVLRRVLPEG